jgi:ribosomal-protein-alanine N-acetyltransferase
MIDHIPVLKTQRLILRKIEKSDLANIYRGLSDPDVTRYYGVSFNSPESTNEQMVWYDQLQKTGTGIWWAICLKKDGRFIGAIGLNDIMWEHRKGEVGFWLYSEYWRNGYVSEALQNVLLYAFDTLNLHRVEGIVESGNLASAKLLQNFNFSLEGTMQDSEVKDGKFISLDVYALIAQE